MGLLGRNSEGLVWKRVAAGTAAMALLAGPGIAVAQPVPGPRYEVATIKPVGPGPMSFMGLQNQPDGIQVRSLTVADLVRIAYGTKKLSSSDRVLGAPDWAKTERYNIDAKMSAEEVAALDKLSDEEKTTQRQQMLQALLVERLGLKAHLETRAMPVYELVVNKGGPKLKEAKAGEELKGPTGKTIAGSVMMFTNGKVRAQQYSMEGLATFLSQPMASVGRPVVDKTGLTGKYSFELTLQVGAMPGMAVKMQPPSEDMPSIFTAVQDELGLKLQPATAALDVVVIDHVDKPTGN